MKRRNLLLGLGGLAGAGGAVGTGAFSSITANRDVTVSVADDTDALLKLEPSPAANGEYATKPKQNGGLIALDFTETEEGGKGLGTDSVYTFDDVFRVTNQGTQPVYVWGTFDDGSGDFTAGGDDTDIWLYPDGDSTTKLRDNGDGVVQLDVGGTVNVGVYVRDVTSDQKLAMTLHADAEEPGGSDSVGSDGPIRVTDSKELQAALNTAPSGATIEMETGDYEALMGDNGIKPAPFGVANPSGLMIKGLGDSDETTIIGSLEVTIDEPAGNGVTVENLTIEPVDDFFNTSSAGFKITSNGTTPGGIRLENVLIDGHDPGIVKLPDGVDGLTITNTVLKTSRNAPGVLVNGTARDVTVDRSVIKNNIEDGFEFNNLDPASDVSITDSNIFGNDRYGIEAPIDVSGVEATGCYFGGENDGLRGTDNRNGKGRTNGNVQLTGEVYDAVDEAGLK